MLLDLVSYSGGDVVKGTDTVLNGERTARLGEYLHQVR